MNDMGRYMFETYSGRWIPDTPSRRRAVVDLKGWNSFSNSSPVEGIVAAVRGFTARIDGSAFTYSAMILQGAIFQRRRRSRSDQRA